METATWIKINFTTWPLVFVLLSTCLPLLGSVTKSINVSLRKSLEPK